MNIKLALGICLPLILVVVLVALSGTSTGFSVEKETQESVPFESIFASSSSPRANVHVQTITVNNDFFMPRRYELPILTACLNDKDGMKESFNLGIQYTEGKYNRGSPTPVFDDIFYDYSYSRRKSVELKSESKKDIKIVVTPRYIYQNKEIDRYYGYDEILLIENEGNERYSYKSCYDLDSEDIESAVRIPIVRPDNNSD